jgi:hypothetical protein
MIVPPLSLVKATPTSRQRSPLSVCTTVLTVQSGPFALHGAALLSLFVGLVRWPRPLGTFSGMR